MSNSKEGAFWRDKSDTTQERFLIMNLESLFARTNVGQDGYLIQGTDNVFNVFNFNLAQICFSAG